MNFQIDAYGKPWFPMSTLPDQFHYNDLSNYSYTMMQTPYVPQIIQETHTMGVGTEPVVQTFYEGPEKCDCCVNWIEKKPIQMPESERERYDRAAICIYQCKDHEKEAARVGGLIDFRYNRVVIQSKLLIQLIKPKLKLAGASLPDDGQAEFLYPFKELYFSYGDLKQLSENYEEYTDEYKLLKLLDEVMKSLFSSLSTKVRSFRSKGTIDYACLWTLFPRGMIVYRKHPTKEFLMRVKRVVPQIETRKIKDKGIEKVHKFETGLYIHCEIISFNGSNFGVVEDTRLINTFDGEKKVTSLGFYPVAFHADKTFQQTCKERGKKILGLQSAVHCGYEGSAVSSLNTHSAFVSGRVIIDPFRFCRIHPDKSFLIERFDDDTFASIDHLNGSLEAFSVNAIQSQQPKKMPWIEIDADRRPSLEEQAANRSFFENRPELLMLIFPCIQGFSLKHNEWFDLHLSKLRDISWSSNPLDSLTFDTSIKMMLTSFSRHHSIPETPAAGPLVSKGQGLVVLLSGPSGTGKTLTAEVIAEETRVPLYRVMAGQLGSVPTDVESKLQEILELALEWRCVVLLDEADTFLQDRSKSDRATCEIVSIFLRRLEYFPGIIFLTTNMPKGIDPAFRSRCRLHIPYTALNAESRRSVWMLNFAQAELHNVNASSEWFDSFAQLDNSQSPGLVRSSTIEPDLSEEDLHDLVAWRLSGREIQNVVQNVTLWCKTDGVRITHDRLKTAIRMTVPDAKREGEADESEDSDTENTQTRPKKKPRLTTGDK